MKILVYGAGVIGCELAHALMKVNNNEVTILARGEWARILKEKGLTIRHYAQFHTTHDKVNVVERLEAHDDYDLIFVAMQQGQLKEVLPVLSRNVSKYILFIGNNLEAADVDEKLHKDPTIEREVAFGFQSTGGRREKGKVISVHMKVGMTVGAINGELSRDFKKRLREAFTGAKYRLIKESQMDGWLKCHAAFVLPLCYVCYALNGNLKKATEQQINTVIDATVEAHAALKVLGYPLRPDGEEKYYTKQRKNCYRMLRLMVKTPIGKLALSDHAMHAKSEIKQLDQSFELLRMQASVPMPAWNKLREECDMEHME